MKSMHVRAAGLVALTVVLALAACSDDSNPFQVIEETEFAASLGVDLAQMERLPSGVYVQDVALGEGAELVYDATFTMTYTGWLSDGTQFDTGTFTTTLEENPAPGEGLISGFTQGILGMQPGGTRLLVIPPEEGYGDRQFGAIPPGSILVFRVTLDELTVP